MVAAATWQLSPQELNKITAKAMRRSLLPSADKTTANGSEPAKQQLQPAGGDDAHALADSYAQSWNDFVAAGMPPSEHEIAEVDAELEGSPWRLQQDADGKWMVVPVEQRPRVAPQQQFSRDAGLRQSDLATARLLDLPDVRQRNDYECGMSSTLSVLRYFGVGEHDPDKLSDILGTNVKTSTSPQAIVGYLTSLGLQVEPRQHMTIADLRQCWREGKPVICCIQEYGLPSKSASYDYGHWVVSIGAALGQVFVQDPSSQNVIDEGGVEDHGLPEDLLSEAEEFLYGNMD